MELKESEPKVLPPTSSPPMPSIIGNPEAGLIVVIDESENELRLLVEKSSEESNSEVE